MALPNRTDRLLHWRIELCKVLLGTLVLLTGGLVALSRGVTWADRFSREGILMLAGLIVGTFMLATAAVLIWGVVITIRALPNE